MCRSEEKEGRRAVGRAAAPARSCCWCNHAGAGRAVTILMKHTRAQSLRGHTRMSDPVSVPVDTTSSHVPAACLRRMPFCPRSRIWRAASQRPPCGGQICVSCRLRNNIVTHATNHSSRYPQHVLVHSSLPLQQLCGGVERLEGQEGVGRSLRARVPSTFNTKASLTQE